MRMDTKRILERNLKEVLHNIRRVAKRCHRNPEEIKLVVVTKGQSLGTMSMVKNLGYVDFGESYVREFLSKVDHIRSVNWHFIGRFYRKQTKRIVGISKYIHSIPSLGHLEKVDRVAASKGITQKVFLQVNVLGEARKQGFSPDGLLSLCENCDFSDFPFTSIEGLMTIAPLTSDEGLIRRCFRNLRGFRDKINEMNTDFQLKDLSIGMSNDYVIAIEEGATILRIGTAIFRHGIE